MASYSGIVRGVGCNRKSLLSRHFRMFVPKSVPLKFGTCYHHAIEFGLEEGIDKLVEEDIFDQKDLLVEMYTRFEQFKIANGIEVIDSEIEFNIDIEGSDEIFRGFIDAIIEWNGEVWLAEFKTARAIDTSHVLIDSQITSYLWACREIGICEPKGVLYIVNQKTVKREPKVLKTGGLSTAKNQGCTYEDYCNVAIDMYGDEMPEKVLAHMEWLLENEKPSLVAIPVKRTSEELDRFGEQLKVLVKTEEILAKDYKNNGFMEALSRAICFPNMMMCKNCDYRSQCISLYKDSEVKDTDLDEDFFNKTSEANV